MAGYPRFTGGKRYSSFTDKQFGDGAALDNGFLVLSKIGRIAVRWSRPIEGSPMTVTICREADGWYACSSCAEVPISPRAPTGQETAIDLGLASFATLADGRVIQNPRCYRKSQAYLRRCQRRATRRKKASHCRTKAVKLLARAQQNVKRQRHDLQHKEARTLVDQSDTVCYEEL